MDEFDLSDFKKWMKTQPKPKKQHNADYLGLKVESKLSYGKLVKKIDHEDAEELAKEFIQYGGIVNDSDDKDNLLIEVDSGEFVIPSFFVKKSI